MRIVGGRFRGRSLATPASRAVRPTSDRLRQAIFNVLEHAYGDPVPGAHVVDLFSGTGALGLEALSRGAATCLFVDNGAESRALLRANIETLGVAGTTRVFRRDATQLGTSPDSRFGLAFLDPPYGQGLARPALAALASGRWLTPGALCVTEEAEDASINPPSDFVQLERRSQGETALTWLRFTPA